MKNIHFRILHLSSNEYIFYLNFFSLKFCKNLYQNNSLNNINATVKKISKNSQIKLDKYLDTLVFKQTLKIIQKDHTSSIDKIYLLQIKANPTLKSREYTNKVIIYLNTFSV